MSWNKRNKKDEVFTTMSLFTGKFCGNYFL